MQSALFIPDFNTTDEIVNEWAIKRPPEEKGLLPILPACIMDNMHHTCQVPAGRYGIYHLSFIPTRFGEVSLIGIPSHSSEATHSTRSNNF